MDAERAVAVAALRERIARLGGLGRPRDGRAPAAARRTGPPVNVAAGPTTPVEAPPRGELELRDGPATALHPAAEAQVRRLGFHPEWQPEGVAWVRRVEVDLGPFLARAGAPAAATPRQLVALTHRLPPGERGPDIDPSACAVMDIETLGLRGSGVVAFVVGVGVPCGDGLAVDQLLLADIGAERALLVATLSRLAGRDVLVSYNGRTFDVPVLRSRCIVNRLGGERLETVTHCDLLAPVRRLFRDRLGACTLRQAELALLGFVREDDISGMEAPERYRLWLRGGDEALIEGVVRHNELDLCATMVLAARLAAHVEGRLVEPVHPADRYRLALHLERHGAAELRDEVDDLYRACLASRQAPWDRQAAHRLARSLARGGDDERTQAVAILRSLWGADPYDLRAARALCILEERRGRLGEAVAVAGAAVEACGRLGQFRLARLRGAPRHGWAVDWERRRARVTLRAARRGASRELLPGVA